MEFTSGDDKFFPLCKVLVIYTFCIFGFLPECGEFLLRESLHAGSFRSGRCLTRRLHDGRYVIAGNASNCNDGELYVLLFHGCNDVPVPVES